MVSFLTTFIAALGPAVGLEWSSALRSPEVDERQEQLYISPSVALLPGGGSFQISGSF